MSNKKLNLTMLVLALMMIAAFFADPSFSYAADPTFLVSWKAEDYAPINYIGKILPVNQTKIDVSFELISNNPSDQGKIIDLSQNQIRWYVNGYLMSQANGNKNFSFITSDDNNQSTAVKISAEYNDASAGYSYFVDKYLSVPISAPDIVVAYKNTDGTLSKAGQNIFSAIPYFFNTVLDNLKILWMVNDQSVDSGNDQWNLAVNLGSNYPSGSDIKVAVSAQDIFNPATVASKIVHFISK